MWVDSDGIINKEIYLLTTVSTKRTSEPFLRPAMTPSPNYTTCRRMTSHQGIALAIDQPQDLSQEQAISGLPDWTVSISFKELCLEPTINSTEEMKVHQEP
ncbi:hypothetical protein NPIL_625021 [Nephila pilipes]|uniref:Uncharacterized protein n=1 Tax=Nephila pilipes TaxID=299642 RepID=A0A8X6J025_NEPPI|nr:hypothetical protein NPIL_625021 [Nephila pilipes]